MPGVIKGRYTAHWLLVCDDAAWPTQVAQLLPATGVGSQFRAALLQLSAGATLNTLGRSTTG